MALTCPTEVQQARTRRRSRFGCRNCKLRKLKPVAANAGRPLVTRGKAKLQPSLTNAVWTADASTTYQLNAKCQDFITRYLGRSLVTPDDPNMIQVNRKLLELAFHYPFLMHASLAVALTYDRHLNGSIDSHRTLEECYHWSQSTSLLNKRLREPIETSDKDPIWGTAAALVILTFSSPDADTPEQSWPLRATGSSDLDWIRMGKGKMSLWDMVNPLRSDSLFSVMAAAFAHMNSPLPEGGIDGIPTALAAVCNLHDSSTAETNAYFHAAHTVSQIMELPDSDVATGHVQLFMRSIEGPFEDLLRGRDPVALLLLYLWYRKVSRCIWWIELRARVECPSIFLYLRLYHKENGDILAFLPGGTRADRWN
ncbi:hypothetical protein PENSUB_930 [Penicillium subrubescens]|uniref:Sterol uptake control protein 2 n=1 Tax=Penicillium subrubescens TaxID=1316194 RepID=A0A1Q5ULG3_9EURO|nr:hypothetical protein PENSUB_930 [Penicillium subrubescens]